MRRDDSFAVCAPLPTPDPAAVHPPTPAGWSRARPHPGARTCWHGRRAPRGDRSLLATGRRARASWTAALAGSFPARAAHRSRW